MKAGTLLLPLTLLLAGCAAEAPAPRPQPVPAPGAATPGFTGLSADALRARLGPPAFTRKDGATEMWRYDAQSCHAFFFFTGGRVRHVETAPEGPGNGADAACLSALRKS